ncbi:Maf family protein [Asticcacaulis sp. EMRT-3]|uniref:Maf family protein n=1 Tax=Asticcacaulis sp. EMRT-3 TaxID=3040349 RepID=UPI0024AF1E4D|nr:Maf family protein [Asticcacaulis sp. EMRT-3]MDI7775827.1 Maf family protein [Asticcacaulis sp. EMRT-3]
MTHHLTLASASASRAALLSGSGLSFAKIPADLDEEQIKDDALVRGLSPKAIALELARAKALHVSLRTSGLVLGGDQVLQLDNDLISKSASLDEARALLKRMSGQSHYLHAGLALAENGQLIWSHVETAEMTVRTLSDAFIDHYLDQTGDKILSSVGCYQLEDMGIHLFDAIRGDYFTVLGLPLLPLLAQLRHLKVIPA